MTAVGLAAIGSSFCPAEALKDIPNIIPVGLGWGPGESPSYCPPSQQCPQARALLHSSPLIRTPAEASSLRAPNAYKPHLRGLINTDLDSWLHSQLHLWLFPSLQYPQFLPFSASHSTPNIPDNFTSEPLHVLFHYWAMFLTLLSYEFLFSHEDPAPRSLHLETFKSFTSFLGSSLLSDLPCFRQRMMCSFHSLLLYITCIFKN